MNHIKYNVVTIVRNLVEELTPFYKDERIAYNNAWDLLEFLTKQDRSVLLAHETYELTDNQNDLLSAWVNAITRDNKPIQYILGTVPFLDLTIYVEPPILIPRPETEEWCAYLLVQIKENNQEQLNILDLCTGSGCIALALAKALPQSTIYATDISEQALELAQKNAVKNGVENIIFIKSDVYTNIPDLKFDYIISNPPYITNEEFKTLSKTVTDWEDHRALVANEEGLALIRKIIAKAPNYLQQSHKLLPQVWIEIGHKQATQVKQLFEAAGFTPTACKDLYGNDRVVTGALQK